MNDWRLIESAPKTIRILLWREARQMGPRPHGAVRGCWLEPYGKYGRRGWVTIPGGYGISATHWQLLPPPPPAGEAAP